ncbi:MAG: endonuclease/exonuclease/phosphatase family protein [Rhizobiaceae bacterium]|nr:endonuclease/exonuclease/phosphatase family protein [Rhizobiaceae bacterium]
MGVRILSLNLWGGRLHDALIPYLAAAEADIFCFQEVPHTPTAASAWLDYRHDGIDLPQRARLLDELRDALPGHDAWFAPSLRGPLLDGEAEVASLWGLAAFVRRDHVVVGAATGFVHGDYRGDGWGSYPRPANAQCLRIALGGVAPALTVAHMHGLRDLAGKQDTPDRLAQADRLAALVQGLWTPGEGLVVCGDFNVLPDSAVFRRLGALGLSDLVTGRGFTDTRTSHYGKPGRFADYMLVNPAVSVAAFYVVADPEVSDHRPLVLDIG